MAVERRLAGAGNDIVGHPGGKGGQQQAEDIVAVKPQQDRIRYPHQGAGVGPPDDIAQAERRGRQDDAGTGIPYRDIEHRLFAPDDRHEKIDQHETENQHHAHVHRPDHLGVFTALGIAGGQGNHHPDQGQVPQHDGDDTQHFAEEFGAQNTRQVVKGGRQQSRRDKTEEHQIDMDGPHPAENDPSDILRQIGRDELGSPQQPHEGGHRHPEAGGKAEPLGRHIGWRRAGRIGRQNESPLNCRTGRIMP